MFRDPNEEEDEELADARAGKKEQVGDGRGGNGDGRDGGAAKTLQQRRGASDWGKEGQADAPRLGLSIGGGDGGEMNAVTTAARESAGEEPGDAQRDFTEVAVRKYSTRKDVDWKWAGPNNMGMIAEGHKEPILSTGQVARHVASWDDIRYGNSQDSELDAEPQGPAGLNGKEYVVSTIAGGGLYPEEETRQALVKDMKHNKFFYYAGFESKFEDGPGEEALFQDPKDLTVDSAGNIYVADSSNNVIRRIEPSGYVTTLSGFRKRDLDRLMHSDGIPSRARYNMPCAIDCDVATGNTVVADHMNDCVRMILAPGQTDPEVEDPRPRPPCALPPSWHPADMNAILPKYNWYPREDVANQSLSSTIAGSPAADQIQEYQPGKIQECDPLALRAKLALETEIAQPRGVAIDPISGCIYVTAQGCCIYRIQRKAIALDACRLVSDEEESESDGGHADRQQGSNSSDSFTRFVFKVPILEDYFKAESAEEEDTDFRDSNSIYRLNETPRKLKPKKQRFFLFGGMIISEAQMQERDKKPNKTQEQREEEEERENLSYISRKPRRMYVAFPASLLAQMKDAQRRGETPRGVELQIEHSASPDGPWLPFKSKRLVFRPDLTSGSKAPQPGTWEPAEKGGAQQPSEYYESGRYNHLFRLPFRLTIPAPKHSRVRYVRVGVRAHDGGDVQDPAAARGGGMRRDFAYLSLGLVFDHPILDDLTHFRNETDPNDLDPTSKWGTKFKDLNFGEPLNVSAPTHWKWAIQLWAGSGEFGVRDGSAWNASFAEPCGLACDKEGNLFVTDRIAHNIRKITRDQIVTTVAGGGGQHDNEVLLRSMEFNANPAKASKDRIKKRRKSRHSTKSESPLIRGLLDGPGSAALFFFPTALAVSRKTNNIYVADTYNHRIRMIHFSETEGPKVSTVVGGFEGYYNLVNALEWDPSLAEYGKDRGKEDGRGLFAAFDEPTGIAVDLNETLYICDSKNQRICKAVLSELPKLTRKSRSKRENKTASAGVGVSPYPGYVQEHKNMEREGLQEEQGKPSAEEGANFFLGGLLPGEDAGNDDRMHIDSDAKNDNHDDSGRDTGPQHRDDNPLACMSDFSFSGCETHSTKDEFRKRALGKEHSVCIPSSSGEPGDEDEMHQQPAQGAPVDSEDLDFDFPEEPSHKEAQRMKMVSSSDVDDKVPNIMRTDIEEDILNDNFDE